MTGSILFLLCNGYPISAIQALEETEVDQRSKSEYFTPL
jgi:hypothetical protein